MIPASPPTESASDGGEGCQTGGTNSNGSRRDSLATMAEKIKFQITIEEPEEEEAAAASIAATTESAEKKELTESQQTAAEES